MDIKIKEITNKKEWDKTLLLFDYSTIFLSWEWNLFEKKQGKQFETFGVYKKDTLIGLIPIKTIHAKRGSYLHVRHAPLINWEDKDVTIEVINFLKEKAKINKVHFIRISPLILPTNENTDLLKKLGFNKSVIHATDAELTVIIDLTKSIEEILQSIKKTTRAMIRKAEGLELTVKHSNNLDLFEDFCEAYKDTVARNKWTAYTTKYIKDEFEIFQKNNCADLFVSYYKEQPISAAIFIRHQNQVIYHFGGSLTGFREIPAAYLLQWEAIKYFKNEGFKIFNFWGVSPEGNKKHPWYGFSLFKRGFTKNELEFIHSHDLDLHPLAKITHIFEYLETKLRGYS